MAPRYGAPMLATLAPKWGRHKPEKWNVGHWPREPLGPGSGTEWNKPLD
ncbi:MAG: hypothetical protein V3S05_06955 [Desulfobacterales bacterium]